jgi:WD40 repeat protein
MLLENVMVSLPRHASENLARALIDLELSHQQVIKVSTTGQKYYQPMIVITCPDTKQITSPDGSLSVYAGFDLTIQSQNSPYYKITGGDLLKAKSVEKFRFDKTINSISISNDAKQIAVGDSAGNIFILDVNNPSDYLEPKIGVDYSVIPFSRIRQSLISGQRIVSAGHSSAVNSIIYNSEGSRFISAGSDGTIRIWDVDSLTSLLVITVPNVEFVSVALDKDESFLVASDTSGKVYCWKNESRDLANHNHKFLKQSYEKFSRLVEAWLNSSNGNFKDVIKKMKLELANYSQADGVVIKNIILQKILEESSRANLLLD